MMKIIMKYRVCFINDDSCLAKNDTCICFDFLEPVPLSIEVKSKFVNESTLFSELSKIPRI